MKKDIMIDAVSQIDDDVIKIGLETREKMVFKKNRKRKYIKLLQPIAACILFLMIIYNIKTTVVNKPPELLTIDATVYPERFSGSSSLYIVGNFSDSTGPNSMPPMFKFDVTNFIVTAKVIRNLPDTYSIFTDKFPYRIIQMQVIEVIRGEGVPDEFYYLIPEKVFVDMSVYDTLVISMKQFEGEKVMLKNATKGKIDILPLIFSDYALMPELGNIIAFTDDIFDESLWQNKSWRFGYQFGVKRLDEAEERETDLVVKRKGTLSETVASIGEKIVLYEIPNMPKVIRLDFKSEKVKKAYEYVTNGVFSQSLSAYGTDNIITFTRYINGCRTNEWVKININTEEVTYSEYKFSQIDMSNLPDIVSYIQNLAGQYRLDKPNPPHMDTKGKKLISLYLHGWYVKTDNNIYGVIKTVWKYSDEKGMYKQYYDDSYKIYNADDNSIKDILRDDLIDIIGDDIDVYQGKYGEEIMLPHE